MGIDNDIAQYIASLIPSDRGQLRSLSQCMNGEKDKGFLPIKQFVYEMTNNYPQIWEVAKKIEGLICGSGVHAGGIIFVDEPFYNSTGLKRAPNGALCTNFDLHDSEACSLIKIDLLSVEAMDKIHNCIDLLCEYGYAERKNTLKETYESIVGIYNLEREDSKMWEMVHNHEIFSLFQMEKQSGINGISIAKPKSVDELAVLNSVIRLMAPEKNAEQPLDMWGRYRQNINEWHKEMQLFGLNKEQIEWLDKNPAIHNGICESQEGLMSLVQEERLGGNNLTFADKCRKAIAKKQGKLFEECEKEYFENAKEKHCEQKLVDYVWNVLFKVQRGYSFCAAHTHAYSLIALQEMNLAYKYPIIFWNCACLITDSGGAEADIEENEDFENEEPLNYVGEIEDFGTQVNEYEEEDEEGYECIIAVDDNGKKKKKTRTANFGKIATAIGKMKTEGIEVAPPNINKSSFTFSPDVDKNIIRFGLSGITRIGEDLIHSIMENRPYSSLEDFLSKVKVNKPQVINLIKSGAFDSFGQNRNEIMEKYIRMISDQKKKITLQNMKMLIDFNLLPDELDFEKRVYNFNKYLKKFKNGDYYLIDEIALAFLDKNYSIDDLYLTENGMEIKQTTWDKIYKKEMDTVRNFIKDNQDDLLTSLNNKLIADMWNKYCLGSLSKWEMDSVSCYFHKHELEGINLDKYGVVDYFNLPENPEIDRIVPIKGKQVPLFKIKRIAGTVLDRDNNKKIVTLLTTSGVITVKIYGEAFTQYDKQISEKGSDGKKHIIEKSMFSRGNKIVVTGIKRDESFIAKKYKATPYHLVEKIEEIKDNGEVIIRNTRFGEE